MDNSSIRYSGFVFVFKTSLAGIMSLYLQTWRLSSAGERLSPLGTGVETSEVESVMIVIPVFFK